MKIALGLNQFFDDEGRPLVNGRVSVYKHDSDIPMDIFYLEGDDYTAAPNPLYTADDGRIATVFYDASVADVKVEKLVGEDAYELMDTFQVGFDYPTGSNDTVAYGMNALKNTAPSVGVVQVVGYHNEADAPARFYVWDPNCNLAADGGVIIESDVGEEGRWILLWDDEKLPCSVYGISPSNVANMTAFLNFGDSIGTWQIRTPKICRFLGGTYTVNQSYSTSKNLYFDRGTKFTQATFTCPTAFVEPGSTSYTANMTFTNKNAIACLSWFRTRPAFRDCAAPVFHIDADYTTDNANVTVSGKEIHYFITPPAWMSIQSCIQIVCSAGMMDATHVSAAGDLSVGRYFLIEPHDNVMNPYYEIYSQGNLSYPTMRLQDNQCVLFHNGITVHEGIDIPGRTVNGTYYPQQWLGYFDDGEDGPTVQIKAKGDIEVTNLKGNLTSTNASIGTLNVTSEAKVSKLMGRNYDFIPLFSGIVRSYSEVDLNWTSYGSHILPTTVPADALIKIHMTWAWNDSSSVPISDYIHLSGASGRSFGDVIALENCGPQTASFTFEDMYRNHEAETIADKSGPIYVIDMSLNLIDIIPAFERHTFMYNGSGWERVSV